MAACLVDHCDVTFDVTLVDVVVVLVVLLLLRLVDPIVVA